MSKELIEGAVHRFQGITFIESDGCKIPLEEAKFDIIFIATVLVHASNPKKIINEAYRLLKPNGVVAILDQDSKQLFYTLAKKVLLGRY